MQNTVYGAECPECATEVQLPAEAYAHEILECLECRSELEIESVLPPKVTLAPDVEEDWGE
ncbi:lysine biosynthesis protein LysW [Pseudonocardia sp. TRM90224]|uniref:lysine biosynthesis protein LysW n=1 Tax=Pseudonocardia sp. TRM90224 TaxID=2812678 RepID=UPI001E287D53|nr:lysine biosynthesis protein LysW [Pseudonocardia sp. TRM90224]